jgi:hypothetical protein
MALTAQLDQMTRFRPTRSEIRAAGTTAATVPIATSATSGMKTIPESCSFRPIVRAR